MTRLRNFLADETGSATIEYCLVIPILMTIFLASVESSMYMSRHAMLERSVDIVVRDIRLGNYDTMTHALLKEVICEGDLLMPVDQCISSMRIWMQPINTADFAMVAPPRFCLDRSAPIDPLNEVTGNEFIFGTDNEIMLMRICLMQDPMFRTSIFGPGMMPVENDDRYALLTTTVFVNEPG